MGLNKNEREIILPVSKTKLTVRTLGPYDYIYTGHIPDTFAAWEQKARAAKAEGTGLTAQVQDFKPAEVEYLAKCCERAVVKVHQAKATDPLYKISGKQPSDCTQNEISFFSLEAGDVDALLLAIFSEGVADVPAAFFRPEE